MGALHPRLRGLPGVAQPLRAHPPLPSSSQDQVTTTLLSTSEDQGGSSREAGRDEVQRERPEILRPGLEMGGQTGPNEPALVEEGKPLGPQGAR